ncbi:glycosyl transferase [Steroidobacter agaridevorans]|uniref:Glycosyl transferase n=1 Tax=Steroidobacter agaridevorans TaxID=2695856 RepID=A0A829YKL9_9GAMM|nr:glycosyltransferase family 4 protein [Steroidobacter agaridevorans]GFE83907.1 glycosyl transferase [Steroidobacter agaridevorans]
MKLLMTADAVGGVWTYALDLCSALSGHGVDVVLATMGPRPSGEQRNAAAALGNVQLVESDYRLEWMAAPWADVDAAGEWLLDLAASNAVDVIHLNGYSHAALPWTQPVVCVAHSCVWTWWQAVYGSSPPARWNEYRGRVATGLNSADIVVAPTAAFLEQLAACYAFTPPTRVIRNGRAPPAYSCNVSRESIVLACGRPWDASKNLCVLDDAARNARWSAYVIGSVTGPDGQAFTPCAVRAVGALPSLEVHKWMHRASIFVHPALYEPFGLVVVEAASAGCALVLAGIPTLRELWNGAAVFFEPRDARSLRAKLDTLLADPERRQELATAARVRAKDYRMESTAAEYLETYRALLHKHENGERTAA